MNFARKQLVAKANQCFNSRFGRFVATMSESSKDYWLDQARKLVPELSPGMHKGEAGRIGIIGGSTEYTGAPYYAGIAALKFGADLVHIFCPQSASIPIKCYSPELIVHPLLDMENAIDLIEPWLNRLHVLVIGSGLGRDQNILNTVSELIHCCKKIQIPLVIDADGLFLITQNVSLLKDYKRVILTPNAMELSRLVGNCNDKLQALAEKVGRDLVVMEKAANDKIYDTENMVKVDGPSGGSNRRCGGQGDLLAGAIATFYHWGLNLSNKDKTGQPIANEKHQAILACYAGSYLIKQCNKLAFEKHGRSMTSHEMIGFIGKSINEF